MARNYVDLSETGEAAGSMLTGGVMNALGFEDKDSALERVFKEADFSTDEGKEAALAAVAKIDPDAYQEMVTQFSNTANTEAATTKTRLDTDNAKINQTKLLNGSKYALQFKSDATGGGELFSIHQFLTANDFEFNVSETTTVAQARALMAKQRKDEKDYTIFKNRLDEWMGSQQIAYVNKRAIEDSGVTIDGTGRQQAEAGGVVGNTPINNFDEPRVKETGIDDAFVEGSKDYNPDASQWDSFWQTQGKEQELQNALQKVNQSLFNFGLETFMGKKDKNTEDRQDAIQDWMGGGYGDAFSYFFGRNPAELEAFVKDPTGWYDANIATIEKDKTFTGSSNEDLFANFDTY